jgi:hypothetical protein
MYPPRPPPSPGALLQNGTYHSLAVPQGRLHMSDILAKLLGTAFAEYVGTVGGCLGARLVEAALLDWEHRDGTGGWPWGFITTVPHCKCSKCLPLQPLELGVSLQPIERAASRPQLELQASLLVTEHARGGAPACLCNSSSCLSPTVFVAAVAAPSTDAPGARCATSGPVFVRAGRCSVTQQHAAMHTAPLLSRSMPPAAAPALRGVLKDVACSLAIAHCTPQQQVGGIDGEEMPVAGCRLLAPHVWVQRDLPACSTHAVV